MKEKEFISKWILSLKENGIKKFPEDFLLDEITEEINLPPQTLVIGLEFFGNYEVLTVDGTAVLQADSQYKAKYIVYSSRAKTTTIRIPENAGQIKSAVIQYENYLDTIIKEIESDYKKKFPGEKRSDALSNEIFRLLNLTRYWEIRIDSC